MWSLFHLILFDFVNMHSTGHEALLRGSPGEADGNICYQRLWCQHSRHSEFPQGQDAVARLQKSCILLQP